MQVIWCQHGGLHRVDVDRHTNSRKDRKVINSAGVIVIFVLGILC